MTSATPPRPSSPTPGAAPLGGGPAASGTAVPVEGTTEVLPAVVQKVTAYAAREIPGVVALGASTSRAVGAVRQTLTGGSDNTAGVRVDLTDDTAKVGLDVEIEYGVGAKELVRSLRRHVPQAVEEIAGVTVTELNIVVTDVHLPGADAGSPPPAV